MTERFISGELSGYLQFKKYCDIQAIKVVDSTIRVSWSKIFVPFCELMQNYI